jgi:TetR/AcrR family fatty acid metabolism transcriptional regulator
MNRHSAEPKRRRGGERGGRRADRTRAAKTAPLPRSGGDKRERILDAAVHVFAHKGFWSSKISEIAREAGVADGTIYLYFKSKDDLLISLFEDRMERVNETLAAAMASSDNAADKLRRFVETHLELVSANRDQAEVLTVELRQSSKFIKEYANPKFGDFLKLLASVIEEGQRKGELNRNIRPHLAARALFGAVDELSLWWVLRGDPREDLTRAAGEIVEMILNGMASHTEPLAKPNNGEALAPPKRRTP